MPSLSRPLPGLTGPGRRARWRRSVLRRVLAATCAALAVLVGLRTVRPPPPPRVEVVVAARAVEAGAALEAADLSTVAVRLDARQPGALRRVSDALGRRVGAPLAPGEALTRTRLVPRSPAEGLPADRVALHVLLADPAAAGLLTTGEDVAVYATAGGEALARDASVLAVDPVAEESALGIETAPTSPRGAVLSLSAPQAEDVLAGHGGLEGPPVVNLTVLRP